MANLNPTKINASKINSPTIAQAEQQRVAYLQTRADLAGEIVSTAAEIRRLRAHLKRTVEDGNRLGISKTELSRLSGCSRVTVYRWLAEVNGDHKRDVSMGALR